MQTVFYCIFFLSNGYNQHGYAAVNQRRHFWEEVEDVEEDEDVCNKQPLKQKNERGSRLWSNASAGGEDCNMGDEELATPLIESFDGGCMNGHKNKNEIVSNHQNRSAKRDVKSSKKVLYLMKLLDYNLPKRVVMMMIYMKSKVHMYLLLM